MERGGGGGGGGAAAPSGYSDDEIRLPSMSVSTLWIALALIPVILFACAGCCALAGMRCWLSLRRSRAGARGGREADPEAAAVPPSAALFAAAMAPAGAHPYARVALPPPPPPPLLNGQFTSFEALARHVEGGPPARRRLPGLSRALVEALPLERLGSAADSSGGGVGSAGGAGVGVGVGGGGGGGVGVGVGGGSDCAVCLQPFAAGDELRRLPACGHALHRDCLGSWLARSACCPLCRQPALPAHLLPGKQGGDDDDSEGGGDESGGRGARGDDDDSEGGGDGSGGRGARGGGGPV